MGDLRSRSLGAIAEIPLEALDRAIGIAGPSAIQADRLAEAGPSGDRDHRRGRGIDLTVTVSVLRVGQAGVVA